MSNILLITEDYSPLPGGVAIYYEVLKKHLNKIVVLTCLAGAQEPGVVRQDWRIKWWPHWLKLLWLTPTVARKNKCRVLAAGHILPVGIICWFWSWFGYKYLVFLHGFDIALCGKNIWKRFITKLIFKRSSLVVANSEFTKQLAIDRGARENTIIVIYPTTNLVWPAQPEIKNKVTNVFNLAGKTIVLSVGRLIKRKNIDSVIRSIAELKSQFNNLVYVVIGDGPEKKFLAELANKLKVPVIFPGWQFGDTLSAWYELCDIFVLVPILDKVDVEGFGIVYLEAQGAGKPVIGSRVGGVPEAIGQAGIIIESEQELVVQLTRLLADKTMASNLGALGRQRVALEFNPSYQMTKLAQMLDLVFNQ